MAHMNRSLRKSLAALAVAGGTVGAYLFGPTLVKDIQFARAEDRVEATREELSHVEGLSSIFRKVGKAVEPSVVNIMVRRAAGNVERPEGYEDMLRKFFPDRDGDGEPDLPEGFDEQHNFDQMGTGSGVIMEVDGGDAYILTNNHVAGGASELRITLADGRVIDNGKVLGTDPKTDLAVVKVQADRVIAATWGDSDKLEKGDWILAFGSPFGYVGSMSHGIVSALNRQAGILGSQGYENFIQVDAPINPGNSGGPLVNVNGQVVGINTAIASRTGSFSGIGFAIPSNQAKFVYESIKEKGKVVRGWLGVSISDVARDPDLARSFGFKGETGVLVQDTFANTPASGKLQQGDIVTALNGKEVKNVQELRNTIAATAPNTELTTKVYRDGKEQDVKLTLGEQPEDLLAAAGRPGAPVTPPAPTPPPENKTEAMGLTLETPTEELVKSFSLGDNRDGALVTKVDPKSAAAKAGLRPGDLVTQVQGQKVADAKAAAEAMKYVPAADGVRLRVVNAEGSRFVFVKSQPK